MVTDRTYAWSFLGRRGGLAVRCLWFAVALAGVTLIVGAYSRPGAGADLRNYWEAIQAFGHGRSPYTMHKFLYPPSALLLLGPLGIGPFDAVRLAYAMLDELAIFVAALLSLRMWQIPIHSPLVPLLLLVVAWFSPVGSEIHLGNVNGLLVAGEAAALLMAVRQRWDGAGLVIGLSLALKPVLLPLLFLFILWRQWRALAVAIAVPVALSALGFAVVPDPGRFFSDALPFLLTADAGVFRDFNASLYGTGQFLGSPEWVVVISRLAVVILGLVLITIRFRNGGNEALRLVDCSSLLLVVAFLAFQFSWNYYGLYFLPLLVSVVSPSSLVRMPLVWLAGLLIGGPDVWLWRHASTPVTHLATMRVTAGMLTLLCAYVVRLSALPQRIGAIRRRAAPDAESALFH